jgi:hypothetical protein
MSIYVRPFKKSDLTAFEPIEPLSKTEADDPELTKAIEDSGLAVSGIRNGEIVGCGGVHPVTDFHGEMWIRLSETCLEHKLETVRWIKEGLKIIEETYPFKQLDAVIQCCFAQSIKMVEYLGFKRTQEITHEGKQWFIYSKRVK